MHSSFRSFTAPTLAAPPSEQPAGHRSGQGADSALPALRDDAGKRPAPSREHATSTPSVPESRDTHDADRPRAVGKYTVSPLVRALDNGWFATSVSIRSGRGAATTDRVLRLTRLFQCAQQAASYARAEALQWISAPTGLVAA